MDRVRNQGGAALITVLVFMVILLILIAGMLSVTGNEVLIAGLQRDSAEAFDHAQAGVEEAVRRLEGGRPWSTPFQGSLAPGINVQVLRRQAGPSASFVEIQSDATVRRARRRLSLLALAVPRMTPPNIVYGYNFATQGNTTDVATGDVYSGTFIRFFDWPPDVNTTIYSGWRVSRRCNDPDTGCPNNEQETGPCYNREQCVTEANADQQPNAADPCTGGNPNQWDGRCRAFPGTRRSVYLAAGLPSDPTLGARLENLRANPPAGCNAALIPGNLPVPPVAVLASDNDQSPGPFPLQYGFDRDDTIVLPTAASSVVAAQAVIPAAWDPDGPDGPLGAWSFPCGIPYQYVPETFTKEDGSTPVTRWFKFVAFEHWYHIYWKLDGLEFKARDGDACTPGVTACLPTNVEPNLALYADFGAIPPFPDFPTLQSGAQQTVTSTTGGDVLNAGDPGINWGQCNPTPTCAGTQPPSDPQIILLKCSPAAPCTFTVNSNDQNMHGLLLVDGNLNLNGNGIYYGTIIVNGDLILGSGNFNVYGGVVARSTSYLTGNITVYAGGTVTNVIVGPAIVTAKSWWER